MALTTTQSQLLYEIIQRRFPTDTPEQLGLRILRVAVNNNPSNAQKTILSNLINSEVGELDAILVAYDADVVTKKSQLQTTRDTANALSAGL